MSFLFSLKIFHNSPFPIAHAHKAHIRAVAAYADRNDLSTLTEKNDYSAFSLDATKPFSNCGVVRGTYRPTTPPSISLLGVLMAEALTDKLKAVMVERGEEVLTGDGWKASWKNVTSSRLDGKALKAAMPEIAAQFTKATTTTRFVLSI